MVAGEVVHDRRDIEACHGEAQLDGVGNNSAAQVRLQNVPTLPRVKVAHDLRPYTQNARRKYRSESDVSRGVCGENFMHMRAK